MKRRKRHTLLSDLGTMIAKTLIGLATALSILIITVKAIMPESGFMQTVSTVARTTFSIGKFFL